MTSIIKSKVLKKILVFLLWVAVWQGLYWLVNRDILVASPSSVVRVIFNAACTWPFWQSVCLSLLRIFAGFILGTVFGLALAVVCCKKIAESIFSPLLKIVQATPVASFIMLAWVWIDRNQIPIFISSLMVIPIVWINVFQGIKSIDVKYIELANVFKIPAKKRIKSIYVPAVLPQFAAAMNTSAGLVWKAGIAAEVLCQPARAIGTNLYNAKIYINTDDIFAWTIVVIIISILLELLLKRAFVFINKKFRIAGLT